MDIDIFIYFTNGRSDFCFSCAIKEMMKRPDSDMSIKVQVCQLVGMAPKCCICGKWEERHHIT